MSDSATARRVDPDRYSDLTGCRSCGHADLKEVLSLGLMPLANSYLTPEQLASDEELFFPKTVLFCPDCSLVQLKETVDPTLLFVEYAYYSSYSDGWLVHSRENARGVYESRSLGENNLVVELASNDGYLLKNFVEWGVPVLGIDPAEGPAETARELGVDTLCEFFDESVATRLRDEGKAADAIFANNVLAHVAELDGFVKGIKILLKEPSEGDAGGVCVIEMPYVLEMIEKTEFDTIYHEHLCYFSLHALRRLFGDRGLHINNVERLKTHGGSLRIFIEHDDNPSATVTELLRLEQEKGIGDFAFYEAFAENVQRVCQDLRDFLSQAHAEGKRVAGYGAAAKGTVLLNAAGVTREQIEYVCDRNEHKQDHHVPGVHCPIVSPDVLPTDVPDTLLILAWNLKDEIMRQQADYASKGGTFVVPIPRLQVVE